MTDAQTFVAVSIILVALFVPLLRGCSWRTMAAFALLFSTVAAMGPMARWQAWETGGRITGGDTRSVVVEPPTDPDDRTGTQRPFGGGGVVFLCVLATAAALDLVLRGSSPDRWLPRRRALQATLLLASASALTIYDFIASVRRGKVDLEDRAWRSAGPALGIHLTMIATVLGAACAARAYGSLRKMAHVPLAKRPATVDPPSQG